MSDTTVEHYAFSDECQHSTGRYRSIGVVTAPAHYAAHASAALLDICGKSEIRELKWEKLADARHRMCLFMVLDHLFRALIPSGIRVSVLLWDTHDSRHTVRGRDDQANFERMFFHLHKAVMGHAAPGGHWHLRPDRRSDLDWSTVHETLGHAGGKRWALATPLLPGVPVRPKFVVRSFEPIDSSEVPLCQVADFFAGVATFTRTKAAAVRTWMAGQAGQRTLFGESEVQLSNRDRERLQVVRHLYDHCTRTKQGVSLLSNGYLHSPRGGAAVNFWHYDPQRSEDRAPTRSRMP